MRTIALTLAGLMAGLAAVILFVTPRRWMTTNDVTTGVTADLFAANPIL